MRFFHQTAPKVPSQDPVVVLSDDNWDDYRFKTLFGAEIRTVLGEVIELGSVKIFTRGQRGGRTEIPPQFSWLSQDFFSLGQDTAYYEQLGRLSEVDRKRYLQAMRDVTHLSESERVELEDEPAWRTSLLRFGQAETALNEELRRRSGTDRERGRLAFSYRRDTSEDGLRVEFNFDDTGALPGRSSVVIGYNGAGKTRLLADIANAASRIDTLQSPRASSALLMGEDTTFGAVIAISYSAFDDFVRPDMSRADSAGATNMFGYVYCGLRRENTSEGSADRQELKSIEELTSEYKSAIRTASAKSALQHPLTNALRILSSEPSFGRIGVDPEDFANRFDEEMSERFAQLSTGHKFVLNIVAQLAANLRPRSLVLLDEPEAHLHPPLVAALLRAITALLEAHDSFAVIATHSPVVLQETPSQHVIVLERFGDSTSAARVEVETFAEGVGAITRAVFHLDSSATDYQGRMRDLAETYSIDSMESLFSRGLSTQGRALAAHFKRVLGTGGVR